MPNPKRRKKKGVEPAALLNQLPVEDVKTFWSSDELIIESPVRLFRWRGAGPRRYFTFGEPIITEDKHQLPVIYFPSVSTIVRETLPTSPYMVEWIARHGVDKARAIADEAADYGTLMHICISQFLVARSFDLSSLGEAVEFHVKQARLKWDTTGWPDKLRSDLLAFAQFAYDYELEPLAIEAVMCSFEDGIAGALDCVARMTIKETGFFGETYKRSGKNAKKGEPKVSVRKTRIIGLLDWKSSRKGFYPEHEYALELYRKIWMRWFGESHPVSHLFNWRPNDWRKRPTYELKDQTGKREHEIPHVIELAKLRIDREPSGEMRYPARIELGALPEDARWVSPAEIAREMTGEDSDLFGEKKSNEKQKRKRKKG